MGTLLINQKGNLGYRYAQMIGWQNNKHWGFEGGAELCRKIMTVDFATNEIYQKLGKRTQVACQRIIAQYLTQSRPLESSFYCRQKKIEVF